MKIAFVYDAVYPWKTGGIQRRAWELSRRLALITTSAGTG